MRPEFLETFTWQNKWIPKVRRIVGARLLLPADMTKDKEEATDLIVLESPGSFRVACRLRTPGYAKRYPFDVTITCRRENGFPCEWDKMILGNWGNWFFYGHATEKSADKGTISPWYLIDLSVTRRWMRENHGPELGPNKDPIGSRCWFYAFDVRRLFQMFGSDGLIDWRPRKKTDKYPLETAA